MKRPFWFWLTALTLATAPMTDSFPAYPTVEAFDQKKVSSIDIRIEDPTATDIDNATITSRLKTKVGDPFSQTTFDSDLKMLSEEYDRVDPDLKVADGQVAITLKLYPRPQIEAIRWHGNKNIKTKQLQKELGFKTSQVYNRTEFNKSFNKLKEYYIKKGYFESQLSYTATPDPRKNGVQIDITIHEGRGGKIDDIYFQGFSRKERSALLEMIQSKKYNFLRYFFMNKGLYNEEMLEQDRLIVVNYLQNEGYADAKVDIRVSDSKTPGKVKLLISADKGTKYHFGKITFQGNILFNNQQIDDVFLIRPGDVYSPEKINDTAKAIKELYGRRGYIEASVQYETHLMEDKPEFRVDFQIDEGKQYKIGLIHVFGNVQTETRVILRESLLIPGETFDSAKLKATQERLENIGYFKNVNVYAVRTQDDELLGENYRDVYIEVDETTTGNLGVFFGFSTTDDIFGGLELSETNFSWRGLRKLFTKPSAVRGGGEYAHIKASIGTKQRTFSIAWMDPYFQDSLWRVGFEVQQAYSKLQSKDYSTNTIGGTFYASYPISRYWAYGAKYRVRYAKIKVASDTPLEEQQLAQDSGTVSAVGTYFGFDSTDSAYKPHQGFRSLIELEFAGVGGSFSFLKYTYTNTLYSPVHSRGTMKYRFDLHFIQPVLWTHGIAGVPLSERFFLGGETTVRGYKPFDIGPHFSNGDPTGGISSSLLSVEYLHSVMSKVDVFGFMDGGALSSAQFHIGTYRLTYGGGIRLEVMKRMPLILGLGFPVNPGPQETKQQFFFSLGGQF